MSRRSVRLIGIVLVLCGFLVAVWGQVSMFRELSEGAGEAIANRTANETVERLTSPLWVATEFIGIGLIIGSFLIPSKGQSVAVSSKHAENREI